MFCDYHLLPHEGIQALDPYMPGKSIQELATEKGLTDIIKLASNENPLGCSTVVKKVLDELSITQLATYPAAVTHPLRTKLSQLLGVDKSMLTLSNGSDSLFTLLLQLFAVGTKKHMLTHEYAFITYSIQAKILNVPIVFSAVNRQFEVDIDQMIAAAKPDTGIIFIANPNNPTGIIIPLVEIKRLLTAIPASTLVVLDEAYYEYAYPHQDKSSLKLINDFPNLVITRTFSKAYGLAGLRLGYAISNPSICELLWRIQLPFAVNQAVLEASWHAIDDQAFIERTLSNNQQGMQQLLAGLQQLDLPVLPSSGNFLCFDCKMNGMTVYNYLLEQGIIVRPLTPYALNNYLRVTIGTFAQNKRFLNALSTCIKELS